MGEEAFGRCGGVGGQRPECGGVAVGGGEGEELGLARGVEDEGEGSRGG